jgi:hypothetical protein
VEIKQFSEADSEIEALMRKLVELITVHWGIKFGGVKLIIHEGQLKRVVIERSIIPENHIDLTDQE